MTWIMEKKTKENKKQTIKKKKKLKNVENETQTVNELEYGKKDEKL